VEEGKRKGLEGRKEVREGRRKGKGTGGNLASTVIGGGKTWWWNV